MVKLMARYNKKKNMTLMIVAAYAPDSHHKSATKQLYLDNLNRCVKSCGKKEILIIGADCNASVGIRSSSKDKVRGPYGDKHVNTAANLLNDYMAMAKLCFPTTFFKNPRQINHATWTHMATHRGFQIDHFMMKRTDLRRVLNAGKLKAMVNSDH